MGSALSRGLLAADGIRPEQLRGTVRHDGRAAELGVTLGFPVTTQNFEAVTGADVVLLCTKPPRIIPVIEELRQAGALDHGPLVISIAAGVGLPRLEEAAGNQARAMRAMPNTPCLVREGMTVLSGGERITDVDFFAAEAIFSPLGRVMRLDEEHMNTVTGLSASGPGFIYVVIESLAEGGVMMGLPRRVATELAAQAVQGAARMVLETGRHPAELKDDVTTPAGCTISGLLSLEDGKLRSVLARGVQAAAQSAAGLGQG